MTDCVWEPLAEIQFDLSEPKQLCIYLLCSRAFISTKSKDDWDKIIGKKSASLKMNDNDDEDEVSFSNSCPDEQTFELQNGSKSNAEAISCYGSASHYSTDDYESAVHPSLSSNLKKDINLFCPLQNSDSGADLSEHFIENKCKEAESRQYANQCSVQSKLEIDWEKFWSENGESIIWKSWIEKFGAFINPNYFDQYSNPECLNTKLYGRAKDVPNELDNKLQSKVGHYDNTSSEVIADSAELRDDNLRCAIDAIPNLKISSYSSSSNLSEVGEMFIKTNYVDESDPECKIIKSNSFGSCASYERPKHVGSDEDKLKIDNERVRSRCSNTNLSVKSYTNTTVTTDSMTNVTKITLSSLDLSCECDSVKSSSFLSTSSEDSSGSSSSGSSTKEEICTEADNWWKKVWNEHYHDQYKSSYEIFIHNYQLNNCKVEIEKSGLNSDRVGCSVDCNCQQKEVVNQEKVFTSRQYLNSVAYCLKRLEQSSRQMENIEKSESNRIQVEGSNQSWCSVTKNTSGSPGSSKRDSDNSDDGLKDNLDLQIARQKKVIQVKRTGAGTGEKRNRKVEKIKKAMTLMGFSFHEDSTGVKCESGCVTYKKKNIRGQNRTLKLIDTKPRVHIFFDDDGNPFHSKPNDCDPDVSKLCDNCECDLSAFEEKFVEPELLGYEAHSSSVDDCDSISYGNRKQKKKKKRLKKCSSLPHEIVQDKNLVKYWLRRYQLFTKFDKGIKLDSESWFSVTPEKLAKHHAERCRSDVIVDAFCGAGGNAIQFAFTCERVIAIDIDPNKIKLAKHNAKIYGVEERIDFIVGDFTKLACSLRGDVVFLSPPWGGPGYHSQDNYNLDVILPPLGGKGLYELAQKITDNVAFFLPRNANSWDVTLLSGPGGEVEIEQNFINRKLKSLTAYFGGLIMDPEDPYI